MCERAAAGLFLDPGLGKTSITLAAFKILKDHGLVRKMLVVAPLRVCYSVWPAEVAKWSAFTGLTVANIHGENRNNVYSNADIFVTNPENLKWLLSEPSIMKNWRFDMLVLDESSLFKHTNTQRFKLLKSVLHKFRRRYILTGSPAANNLIDIYGQIYILDQGATLGKYITKFRLDHFTSGGFDGRVYTPKPDAEAAISKKISNLVMRLSAEDYLKLPPIISTTINVALPPAARKVYKEMQDELIAQLGNEFATAVNKASAVMKCRQIANGGIFLTPTTWRHIHDEKVKAVQDLVEELEGQPALIAYDFQHDLERLKAAFPNAPHIGSGVSVADAAMYEEQWNAGQLPVLLAHPQSIAHGLNLQRGRAVIWASLTWDYERYDQFIRRVWRQGQTGPVFLYHIIATDTVDEVVMKNLQRKNRTQESFFDALTEHYLSKTDR